MRAAACCPRREAIIAGPAGPLGWPVDIFLFLLYNKVEQWSINEAGYI